MSFWRTSLHLLCKLYLQHLNTARFNIRNARWRVDVLFGKFYNLKERKDALESESDQITCGHLTVKYFVERFCGEEGIYWLIDRRIRNSGIGIPFFWVLSRAQVVHVSFFSLSLPVSPISVWYYVVEYFLWWFNLSLSREFDNVG